MNTITRIASLASVVATLSLAALATPAHALDAIAIGPDTYTADRIISRTSTTGGKNGHPLKTWVNAYLSTGLHVIGNDLDGTIITEQGAAWSSSVSTSTQQQPPAAKPDRCLDLRWRGRWWRVTSSSCTKAKIGGRRVRRHGTGLPPRRRFTISVDRVRVTFTADDQHDQQTADRALGIVLCGSATAIGHAIAYATSAADCPAAIAHAEHYAPQFGLFNSTDDPAGCVPVASSIVCATDNGHTIIDDNSAMRSISRAVDAAGSYWQPSSAVAAALTS